MKSAQLSIAAYYANNYEYYNAVATGEENTQDGEYIGKSAHCVNARMFGMVSVDDYQEAVKTQEKGLLKAISLVRKKSKGASFGVIFGCSGKKLAGMLGVPENEGNNRKNQFLSQMGLDGTTTYLKECELNYTFKNGWMLPLAFGYWLWNDSGHKNVNTIVQGYEALAQKLMSIKFSKEVLKAGLKDVKVVLDVHDEKLIECNDEDTKAVGELACKCYTWAAEEIYNYHLKKPDEFCNFGSPLFPIDLAGGYKVGKNYFDSH